MEKRDFFISYTKQDEIWALWIANVLKSNGYTAYVQALDIGPGDNFLEKMNKFLKNSRNFIAVWSQGYSESWYCMKEMEAAFKACHEKRMDYLLPVRIDNYPLEPLYSALVYVDLFSMGSLSESKLMDNVRRAVPYPQNVLYNSHDDESKTLYEYGNDHYNTSRVNRDYAKVWEHWQMEGEKGNAEALNNLGYLYYWGQGVGQDYLRAQRYWEQAASMDYTEAWYNLGYLYSLGRGVARDYIKAKICYERAAKKNHADALYNLGVLYEYGQGVEKNYLIALEYYQKAANAGNENAIDKVEELRKKVRR